MFFFVLFFIYSYKGVSGGGQYHAILNVLRFNQETSLAYPNLDQIGCRYQGHSLFFHPLFYANSLLLNCGVSKISPVISGLGIVHFTSFVGTMIFIHLLLMETTGNTNLCLSFRGNIDRYYKWSLSVFPIEKNKRILDLGCGLGMYFDATMSYATARYVGVDCSQDYLNGLTGLMAGRPNCETMRLDLLDSGAPNQFNGASFDYIFCFDVLEHLEDDAKVLVNVHRIMANTSAGRLFLRSLPCGVHLRPKRPGYRPLQTVFQAIARNPAQADLFQGRVDSISQSSRYHSLVHCREDSEETTGRLGGREQAFQPRRTGH